MTSMTAPTRGRQVHANSIQELVSSDAAELHLRDPIFRSRLFPALAERFIQDITSAKGGNV
jgi:hypothetical protein